MTGHLHYHKYAARRALHGLLLRMQDYRCGICGGKMHRRAEWPLSCTTDHVIPKSRGGPDSLGNFVVAHGICNSRKGDRMPTGCEILFLLSVNNRLGIKPAVLV